jgi:hypothetical protein
MKRALAGFCAGLLFGSTGIVSAGFYYSARDLLKLRGERNGDAFVAGYVAGVHDVMAGPYPPNQSKLGEIKTGVIDLMLRQQDLSKPAYLYVVGYLVSEQFISQEDIARVVPEPWRGGEVPPTKKENF